MSSSSSIPRWVYDVFINFRGEDVRDNFVSHLIPALSDAGINLFVDSRLEKGKELGPALLRAIERSRISLIVLSENYAGSTWCLDELVRILECRKTYGQVVLPIFYKVDPGVVRRLKGHFGEALQATAENRCLKGEGSECVLSRWRSALTQTANLSGWDLTTYRSEGELVKQIVEDILTILRSTLLPVTEFPVGLESRVQNVIEFIKNQSNRVCTIGVWGIGGSGKTTTAKAIYNQIQSEFVDRSFIENIREVCEKDNRGYIHLQQQLLSDVLKTKEEEIRSIAMGRILIDKRLQGKRALIVLDDVTGLDQLLALGGNPKLLGSGSVIIVTTRNAHLLHLLKVDYVCTMKEMDENESLELFSWHAFKQPSPREDFSQLSRVVVAYCGGLPLAIEVLGSYLYDRKKPEWKSVLSKLERIPNNQVQEKLRISYDGLRDDLEKEIFLDICCFFIGMDRAYVTEILNSCELFADIGIQILIDQGLVKIENNKLGMHGLLRDMGREIVRESSATKPGRRSRLWSHEDVHDVLITYTGTETVKGLVFKCPSTRRACFSTDSFKEMKKLRLLQLDCVDLTGDYGYLSKQLKWLHWRGFALDYIPDDFYQGNLVVIDLKHSNIKQVWKETKLLEKLKILNVSHSKYLKNTPDFSKLPNLEKLIMKDCPSLSEVHQSIGDLKSLLLLNLKDCTSLSNLPREIYQLKSLKTLILSGCSKIDKLEEDIVQMESLTTLIAKDTGIKEVPNSIVRSKSIEYISLCGYEGLSHDVFASLIWSWMSPTMNSLPCISPFGGMSSSQVSLDAESDNLGYLSPTLCSFSRLRSFWVQYRLEVQVTQEFREFLDDLFDVNFTKWETTSHASQSSDLLLRSHSMGMGSCHIVIDSLGKSISQAKSGASSKVHKKTRLAVCKSGSEEQETQRLKKKSSKTIQVDSDEEDESLPPLRRSRKASKSGDSSDGESTPSIHPIILKEKSNSLRKEIENPQQSSPSVKNKAPNAIEVPSDSINSLPQEKILEKGALTSIPLTSLEVKQEKVKESISTESSGESSPSKGPAEKVEKVSSKQESIPEYSPTDYSKYKELIEEDPLAMMEKLLSNEHNRSSKTPQFTNQAETTKVERESIETLLDDLRQLVFTRNLLKYLPNDMNLREKVKDLLFKLKDRVHELSEKEVLGLAEFTKIFKEATINIDDGRANADSLQELEVNHKNSMFKLQASQDKIKRFDESIAAGQNKIKDADLQIENIQAQIRQLKKQVNKLHQEKSLLKVTCSKCQEKRVKIVKEVKSISSDAVQILEKISHLEKNEQEFDLNYKRLKELYAKMKSAPPF